MPKGSNRDKVKRRDNKFGGFSPGKTARPPLDLNKSSFGGKDSATGQVVRGKVTRRNATAGSQAGQSARTGQAILDVARNKRIMNKSKKQ